MLIACHLFVGAVIGMALYRRMGGHRAVIVLAMIASILPDLVDKPIGHVLMEDSLDQGRLVMHMALAALVPFGLAFALRGDAGRDLAIIGVGLLAHQVLDGMYIRPEVWLWPISGSVLEAPWSMTAVIGRSSGNPLDLRCTAYFSRYLVIEMTSLTEWAFGISTVLITAPALMHLRDPPPWAMWSAAAFLLSSWALVALPRGPPMDVASVTLTVVSLGGAYLLMTWPRWKSIYRSTD